MFEEPFLLYLIPVQLIMAFLFLGLLFIRERRDKIPLATRGSPKYLFVKGSLFFIGLSLLILSLAGVKGDPHFSAKEVLLEKAASLKANPLFILIDNSRSMLIRDCANEKSRLECAKEIALKTIHRFQGSPISLYEANLNLERVVPKTLNTLFIEIALDGLVPNEGSASGTDYIAILEQMKSRIALMEQKPILLFISDGGDTAYEAQEKELRAARLKEILIKASELPPIYTVAIGSATGGEIPHFLMNGKPVLLQRQDATLEAIATASKGKFFVNELDEKSLFTLSNIKTSASAPLHYSDYTAWPLFGALTALLLFWLLPETNVLRLILPLMMALGLESSELSLDALIQSGQCDSIESYLKAYSPESDWEQGAKAINLALCALKRKDQKQALDTLELIELNLKSDPSLLALYKKLLAEAIDDPFLANLLSDGKIKPPNLKRDPISLLALAIEWEAPSDHKADDEDPRFQSLGATGTLASAYINFRQGDIEESTLLFNRAHQELLKEAKEAPPYRIYSHFLESGAPTSSELKALNEITSSALSLNKDPLENRKMLLIAIIEGLQQSESRGIKNFLQSLIIESKALIALERLKRYYSIDTDIRNFLPSYKNRLDELMPRMIKEQESLYKKMGLCFSWGEATNKVERIKELFELLQRESAVEKRALSLIILKEIEELLNEILAIIELQKNHSLQNEVKNKIDPAQYFRDQSRMDQEIQPKESPTEAPQEGRPW